MKNLDTKDLSTKNQAFIKLAFEEYLRKGGFPETFKLKNQQGYVVSLMDAIIKKEIAKHYKIRYVEALRKMANHNSYLKQAFLFQGINKFTLKSAERIRDEKAYLVDVAFQSDREGTLTTDNLGFRMENIVYIELLRRYKGQSIDVFYHKNGYEVDFIIVDKTKILEMIQVTWKMDTEKARKRESGGLVKAHKDFKCDNLTLITLNERGHEVYDGVPVNKVTIVDWLLDSKQLSKNNL